MAQWPVLSAEDTVLCRKPERDADSKSQDGILRGDKHEARRVLGDVSRDKSWGGAAISVCNCVRTLGGLGRIMPAVEEF